MSPERGPGGVDEADLARFRAALRRMSMHQGYSQRVLRGVIRVACWVFAWHVEVGGAWPATAGRSRGAGCVVTVSPHRAWLEPFLLLAAWPPDAAKLVWLADGHTVTRSWWRRTLLPHFGVIPISGKVRGPRHHAVAAAEALAAGAAVVVFPEVGLPAAADRTRRISAGFAYIARYAGAPVIPVVVGGTHRIVRGSSFSFDLLAPIEVGAADPGAFSPACRRHVHALAADYAEVVAAVLPRRTAWADARRPGRERWRWLATLLE